MIERLCALLADLGPPGQPPAAREVAEVLWLARVLPERSGVHRAPVEPRRPAPPAVPDGGPPQPDGEEAGPAADRLYLPGTGEAGEGTAEADGTPADRPDRAAPVRVPGPATLPRRREVARALRPLKRRVPSTVRTVLDEDATAARIADHHHWMPVLTPAADRWLDALVVLDAYEGGAAFWEPLGRELRTLLQQSAAFRDVRLLHLRPRGDGTPGLAPRAGTAQELLRPAGCAVDPTGRTLTLVLTDGVAPQWRAGGPLRGALRAWAGSGPTAVLQTLPEHVWEQTALAPRRGRFRSTEAGGPNSRLLYAGYGLRPQALGQGGVAVPVLAVTPEWLGPWARAVAGPGAFDGAAVLLPAAAAGPYEVAGPPQRQVSFEDFRARAQPDVFRLAGYLAAAPLNLAVMRTVQSAMLPGSPPSDLAEIVFSGLLRRVPGGDSPEAPGDDPLGRGYDFAPGMRERLLGTIRRDEADEVIAAVSAYVDRHAPAGARFTAAVADPAGPLALPAGARHWAEVRHLVRRRQGRQVPPAGPEAPTPSGGLSPGPALPDPLPVPERTPVDMAAYVLGMLLDGRDSRFNSPFARRPDTARQMSEAIAQRVGASLYLAQQLAARALEWRSVSAVGNSVAGFLDEALLDMLPDYFARYGDDAPRAERLLHALSYAEGDGFSTPADWAAAATAVSGTATSAAEVEWFLRQAEGLVAPRWSAGYDGHCFRLPHESWAELLSHRPAEPSALHAAIAVELARTVPSRFSDRSARPAVAPDWSAASPYIRLHLVAHAAAGGLLDAYLRDPDFVLWAEPTGLRQAAGRTPTRLAYEVGTVIGVLDLSRVGPADAEGRRDVLALTALMLGFTEAARHHARGDGWTPAWSAPEVSAVALGSVVIDGSRRLVTGAADGSLSVVDISRGTRMTTVNDVSYRPVASLGCVRIAGRPHAVTGNADRTVTVRDLRDGSVRHRRYTAGGVASTVACTTIGGRPYALFGSAAENVGLWDLATGETVRLPDADDVATGVFACTVSGGEPYAVLGVGPSVQLRNLAGGTPALALPQSADVTAVACVANVAMSYAVLGLADGVVGILDLDVPSQASVRGLHGSPVVAVATGFIGGRPHAASSDSDGVTRVWDLAGQGRSPSWLLRLPRPASALHLDMDLLTVAMDGRLFALDLRPRRDGVSRAPERALPRTPRDGSAG